MTNENKTETTEVEKQVDAEETSVETQEDQQEEASNIENQIDYKAIAEKAEADKRAAEEALARNRYKASQAKKGQVDDDDDEDEGNRPITLKDLQEFQAQERQRLSNEFNSQQINTVAGQISSTDDEKQAILAVHANRTFPEGMSVQDQLTEVKLIVNKDRILGENSEMKRALSNKSNVSKEYVSVQHDSIPSKAGEPQMSGHRKDILKDFTFNKGTKQYEKKLSSGTLVHDPKTGQNQFVPHNS